MNVWLVSPAWGRFAVTRLALAQRAHLIGELASRGVDATCVVIADDENLDVARGHGFATIEMDNTDVGRKWNAGISYACEHGADFVTVVGSDNWVHADLFEFPEQPPRRPPVVLTGRRMAFVDLPRGVMQVCHFRGKWGVIPWLLPRQALAPSKFNPIKPGQMRGLDGNLAVGLKLRPDWLFHDPHDLCRVDFKSSTNLTSYAALEHVAVSRIADPWALLADRYPADLVEMARDTSMLLAEEAVAA